MFVLDNSSLPSSFQRQEKAHREAQNCKQTSLTMLNISKNISIFAMLSSSWVWVYSRRSRSRMEKKHAKSYKKSSFLCIDNLRAFFFICHNILLYILYMFFLYEFSSGLNSFIETYKRSTKKINTRKK